MPRPDDASVQRLTRSRLDSRVVVRQNPGRCVERVECGSRTFALKWRHDREDDREAILYAGLAPALLAALGAPSRVASVTAAGTHLLLLDWAAGRHADFTTVDDVRRVFAHLGRAAALSTRLLRRPRAAFATDAAWRLLLPDPVDLSPDAADPAVLDPGDVRADNVLLRPDGVVTVLDFENMAIRPRSRAIGAARRDAGLTDALARIARQAYWRGAGWAEHPDQRPAEPPS